MYICSFGTLNSHAHTYRQIKGVSYRSTSKKPTNPPFSSSNFDFLQPRGVVRFFFTFSTISRHKSSNISSVRCHEHLFILFFLFCSCCPPLGPIYFSFAFFALSANLPSTSQNLRAAALFISSTSVVC